MIDLINITQPWWVIVIHTAWILALTFLVSWAGLKAKGGLKEEVLYLKSTFNDQLLKMVTDATKQLAEKGLSMLSLEHRVRVMEKRVEEEGAYRRSGEESLARRLMKVESKAEGLEGALKGDLRAMALEVLKPLLSEISAGGAPVGGGVPGSVDYSRFLEVITENTSWLSSAWINPAREPGNAPQVQHALPWRLVGVTVVPDGSMGGGLSTCTIWGLEAPTGHLKDELERRLSAAGISAWIANNAECHEVYSNLLAEALGEVDPS